MDKTSVFIIASLFAMPLFADESAPVTMDVAPVDEAPVPSMPIATLDPAVPIESSTEINKIVKIGLYDDQIADLTDEQKDCINPKITECVARIPAPESDGERRVIQRGQLDPRMQAGTDCQVSAARQCKIYLSTDEPPQPLPEPGKNPYRQKNKK